MAMKQRECVLKHVQAKARDFHIKWHQGEDIKKVANKEFIRAVVDATVQDIASGACDMKNAKQDPAELRRYVVGMVNDAFRKDRRLNGDVKYEFKNPGTRAGSGDERIKTLRQLLRSTSDEPTKGKIQREIDSLLESLKPAAPQPDLSVLPQDMLKRLGLK